MKMFYILKFSIISLIFSIVAIVMHLIPSADILFIKKSDGPDLKNAKTKASNIHRGKAEGQPS